MLRWDVSRGEMEYTAMFSVGKKKTKITLQKLHVWMIFQKISGSASSVAVTTWKFPHKRCSCSRTINMKCSWTFTKFFVMLLNSFCDCFGRLVFVAYDSVKKVLTSTVSEVSLRRLLPPPHPPLKHPWVKEWTRLTFHTSSFANVFRLYRLPKAERLRATGNNTEQPANITIVPVIFFF